VDIARLAHTTLVVEAPGLGDEVQAIKAGILEVADILVVNKADRPGVENTVRALKGMLELGMPQPRVFQHHGRQIESFPAPRSSGSTKRLTWVTPLIKTVATEGDGARSSRGDRNPAPT
jgi:LAO/AO transport system kinase